MNNRVYPKHVMDKAIKEYEERIKISQRKDKIKKVISNIK